MWTCGQNASSEPSGPRYTQELNKYGRGYYEDHHYHHKKPVLIQEQYPCDKYSWRPAQQIDCRHKASPHSPGDPSLVASRVPGPADVAGGAPAF